MDTLCEHETGKNGSIRLSGTELSVTGNIGHGHRVQTSFAVTGRRAASLCETGLRNGGQKVYATLTSYRTGKNLRLFCDPTIWLVHIVPA